MATARLRAGAQRRVCIFSVETAAPCLTAYNVRSRIAPCSNHLNVAKASRNSYSSVTVDSVRTCHLRMRHAWRSRALWSMAFPYFLYGTYS